MPSQTTPPPEPSGLELVRADPIEAWAPRVYALEALPGYSGVVRQAVMFLYRTGAVHYVETTRAGIRGFRAKNWRGTIADLGGPKPSPAGFIAAKALHLRSAQERSFVVSIDGARKIIWFTGVAQPHGLPRGSGLIEVVPKVGDVTRWIDSGVVRARNPHSGSDAVAAARVWRAVLSGELDPDALPLLQPATRRSS
jgi:hypothetical protein